LVAHHGQDILRERNMFEAVIARGAGGGTAESVARVLGVSERTLRRRLSCYGLTPRELIPRVRLRAYELRVDQGTPRVDALLAGAWGNHEARRKAKARHRKRVQE
jgi:AraC-like DNA-binding protein